MTGYTGNVAEPAWFPEDAEIKIERKDQTYTPQTITTEVTNFTDGGGAKESESIAHFGGAFLTIKKPQEDFTVSFDVDLNDTKWAQVLSGDITSVTGSDAGSAIKAVSGGVQDYYKIRIEWKDAAGSDAFKIIYYNALGVTYEKENAADDYLKATISFKLAPTSDVGSGQRYEIETSALYDPLAGSTTGSYSLWEETADTLFGYGTGSMG